jgi:hypothetical protein
VGWPQTSLIVTFLGGLQEKIADDMRMLKPSTLRDTIELARMKDDRLTRQQRSDNSGNFIPAAKRFQLQPPPILDVPLNPVPKVPLNQQATSANPKLKNFHGKKCRSVMNVGFVLIDSRFSCFRQFQKEGRIIRLGAKPNMGGGGM